MFHVFNRAIQNLVLFEQPADYHAFLSLLREAAGRFKVRLLAYCVMPNHWHMVVCPSDDSSLSAFMQWLTSRHAVRWRRFRGSTGRGALYQGRFKAIPVQTDVHLLRLCLYVERNALRARLVARAEDWPWSSARPPAEGDKRPSIEPWPVMKPPEWLELLNLPQPTRELGEIRQAIRRGRPYGNVTWQSVATRKLAWSIPTRQPGRPPTTSHALHGRHLFF